MAVWDQAVGVLVESNNRRVHRVDPVRANPRPVAGLEWHRTLAASTHRIRSEWDRFVERTGRLPDLGDVLGQDQGNEGPWRAGILVTNGRITELGRRFPQTCELLTGVPGLKAALWSVLEAGTELPQHHGPNAGVLRYHLGIDCPADAALRVAEVVVPYVDGEGILFDDTEEHAAWNRSDRARVTLFCEIERPLPGRHGLLNQLTQRALAVHPQRRRIRRRADELHTALNPGR